MGLKLFKGYRRRAKITKEYQNVPAGGLSDDQDAFMPACLQTRGIYVVSIKVKIIGPIWITIWQEACSINDLAQRNYMDDCAEEVLDKINESI